MLQVMTTKSVSYVFALVDDKKNTTSTSCRGSRPSWALVGVGCSNQMQVVQGIVLSWLGFLPLCKLLVLLTQMPTCPLTCVHKQIWALIATPTVWWILWFVVVVVVYKCTCVWCGCGWMCVHVCGVGVCACVCAWGTQTIKKINGKTKTTSQQVNNVFDNVFNENVISSYCKNSVGKPHQLAAVHSISRHVSTAFTGCHNG